MSRDNNEIFNPGQQPGMPTRNVMKDDFEFEIPTESVPLPSRGLVYPADTSLYNRETVEIRPMTAKEEDILTSRALIKKGTVISHLLKSCVVDKSIDTEKMLSGDRNALMVAVRITGYGSSYNVEVDCPACGQRQKAAFSLSELPIKRLAISPVAEGANLFEVELPLTKKKVQFKFLTGEDEQEIAIMQERKKKTGQLNENLVTTRLKYAITSVGGITDKNKIAIFVSNMPARDSLFLRKHIDDNEPGIDLKSWLDCISCFESSEVNLPLGATFFWPDA